MYTPNIMSYICVILFVTISKRVRERGYRISICLKTMYIGPKRLLHVVFIFFFSNNVQICPGYW